LFAVCVAVALLIGFFWILRIHSRNTEALNAQALSASDAPISVDVVSVKSAPASIPLTLPGETRAWYATTIYARVNGYVAKWLVDIGDRVEKGQVLATIETPEVDQQLIASQAKQKASDAEVSVAQANADFAKTTYDRFWDSPKGVVSDQEREQKKAELNSSLAKLNAAKEQVNLDKADVDRLKELTRFRDVRAPFAGIITSRRIDLGDLVTAGSTANTTSLYSLAQADQIRVFVDVPQDASVNMIEGTPAIATASEFPDRTFQGKVARTSRSIDPSSRTLRVEVDVANPDLALLPGMYVQVNFQMKQNPLLQVPASALIVRSTGPQVAVVDADGKVSFRKITIARDMGDVIEVASGLTATDRVAMNISAQVVDGDRVNATQADDISTSPAPHVPAVTAAVGPQ
jgi:RND family efflux transporter MFP subunit